MFTEFFYENLLWFGALILFSNLLLLSFVQDNIRGVSKVSVLEMPALQRNDKSLIIDVNDKKQFALGHISNSVNFPLSELNESNTKLLKNKDRTSIIVCESGVKSSKAAKALLSLGFTDLHILNGGLSNWRKENLPISTS